MTIQLSTETTCKHITMNALLQILMEKIDELEGLDPLWVQKMKNLSNRYIKAINEHLSRSLDDKEEEGKLLQTEILIATNEIMKGLEQYEKKMIKHLTV